MSAQPRAFVLDATGALKPDSRTPRQHPVTTRSQRKCHLTTADLFRLDLAVAPLVRLAASDYGVYLVGSAGERSDFRDVDVRMILTDEKFDRLFGHSSVLWEAFSYAWSRTLSADTGLPVDFQVQRSTEANENHVTGTRNPLSGGKRRFAGLGDATRFDGGPDE